MSLLTMFRKPKTRRPRLAKVIDKKYGKGASKTILIRHRLGDSHAARQISMAYHSRSGQDDKICGGPHHRRLGGV